MPSFRFDLLDIMYPLGYKSQVASYKVVEDAHTMHSVWSLLGLAFLQGMVGLTHRSRTLDNRLVSWSRLMNSPRLLGSVPKHLCSKL